MPFLDPRLSVDQVDAVRWRLNVPLAYGHEGKVYAVPEGYITDFASVPRLIWPLIPRYGVHTAAAVLHDCLITDELPRGEITSREIDRIFREALNELGVSFARRWLMWTGVRWGAVLNPARRRGVLRDLPLMLLLSVLALPFVLPALAFAPSLALFTVLDKIT